MRIECRRCLIRPWARGDVPTLPRHANNYNIWIQVRDRFPHPYTGEHARQWVEAAAAEQPQTNFAIDVHGEAVGGIGLILGTDVDRVSAELGYWIGESYWNRGIVTEAVRAFSDRAFETYDLTRVFAIPFVRNAASRRVLEKAGFELETILRMSAIKAGVIEDQALYARLRPKA
jgi:RimJ/RimL family protein N-acetyltransferase